MGRKIILEYTKSLIKEIYFHYNKYSYNKYLNFKNLIIHFLVQVSLFFFQLILCSPHLDNLIPQNLDH